MHKKLRHAIIGVGGISPKHFDGYAKIGDRVETVAICDIDEKRLTYASKTYSIPDVTYDYKTIFARQDIDFVSICLPNYLHAPVTIEALASGKHVHCEKPMAMNAREAYDMLDASHKNQRLLMIALNNRFTPYAQYIKGLSMDGWFGDIYFAKCGWLRRGGLPYKGWYGEKRYSGGGALIDLGVHFIDLTMYIMDYPKVDTVTAKTYHKFGGSEISPIYAFQQMPIEPGLPFEVDDLASGFICLKNDASIQFEISWASNIEKEYYFYDIYGTKGGASFRLNVGQDAQPTLKLFTAQKGQLVNIEPLINANAYPVSEFSHFVDSIIENKQPNMALPVQGVSMMEIIDAIYASGQSNRQIVF